MKGLSEEAAQRVEAIRREAEIRLKTQVGQLHSDDYRAYFPPFLRYAEDWCEAVFGELAAQTADSAVLEFVIEQRVLPEIVGSILPFRSINRLLGTKDFPPPPDALREWEAIIGIPPGGSLAVVSRNGLLHHAEDDNENPIRLPRGLEILSAPHGLWEKHVLGPCSRALREKTAADLLAFDLGVAIRARMFYCLGKLPARSTSEFIEGAMDLNTTVEWSGNTSPEQRLLNHLVTFWRGFRASEDRWKAGMEDAHGPNGEILSHFSLPRVIFDLTSFFRDYAVEYCRLDPTLDATDLFLEIRPAEEPQGTERSVRITDGDPEEGIDPSYRSLSGLWEVTVQKSWELARGQAGAYESCESCRIYDSQQEISPATTALSLPDTTSVIDKLREQIETAIQFDVVEHEPLHESPSKDDLDFTERHTERPTNTPDQLPRIETRERHQPAEVPIAQTREQIPQPSTDSPDGPPAQLAPKGLRKQRLKFLDSYAKRQQIKYRRGLAHKLCVSPSALYGMVRGDRKRYAPEKLDMVLKRLGVSLDDWNSP